MNDSNYFLFVFIRQNKKLLIFYLIPCPITAMRDINDEQLQTSTHIENISLLLLSSSFRVVSLYVQTQYVLYFFHINEKAKYKYFLFCSLNLVWHLNT